jgi:hypothetical protein
VTASMDAAAFVRAALLEVGYDEVAPYIHTNRGGFPSFRWREMDREPSDVEIDACVRAFDLWYRSTDRVLPDGASWDGYSPAAVRAWGDLIRAVGRD